LALYFPAVSAAIDWTRGYEWLNTELRQVVRDADLGTRLADVLVKVWRHDGTENWLLIHIEVQGWPESDFPRRMFVYHYRIFDRYNRQVVSLAVLADDRPNWRPDRFAYDLWGCGLDFHFPVVKLLDFIGREAVLEASENPFALITRAHLATLQTRQDPATRHAGKIRLIRELYERGMSREDVLQLFRIIDWMMDLPEVLEQLFRQEAEQIEQEKTMPYVTSVERLAKRDGQIEMLIDALQRRFKTTLPQELAERIHETKELTMLGKWLDLAYAAASLEEFQQRMQS
jgi:SOS response regulatory protein OraA/RecX